MFSFRKITSQKLLNQWSYFQDHASSITTASVQNVLLFKSNILFRHLSITSSTILCEKHFQVSIKRCLRSVTPGTGVWYTWSCIMPHIQQSTGLRSSLFRGQRSGGMIKVGHKVLWIHGWLCPVRPFQLCQTRQLMFPKVCSSST